MPLDYKKDDANKCWPEADYDAELLQVLDKVSKTSGNDMQEWKVKVMNDDGKSMTISDYFCPPGGTFKLKQLAKALGKEQEFNAETFQADDHEGAQFKVHLVIEEGDGGYPDKNKIQKYLSAKAAPAQPSIKQQVQALRQPVTKEMALSQDQQFKGDDIPF